MMWSHNFIMIHPERTGGTILTNTFGNLPYVSKEVYMNKHCNASRAKYIIGDTIWNNKKINKICLYRDEEERNESWFKHVKVEYEKLNSGLLLYADSDWVNFLKTYGHKTKEDFMFSYRLPPVKWYCDQPNFQLLKANEVYTILVELTGYDPGVVVY